MQTLVTIVLALVLSWLGGSMAAVLIADWTRGDEAFVLAFMAIPLAGLVALAVFLFAAARTSPARAIGLSALALIALLVLLLAAMSVFELYVNGTVASAWRGVQLLLSIVGSCIVVVAIQWAIFRWRSRAASQPMLFGRDPGAPA